MATLVEKKYLDDILAWVASQEYSIVAAPIKNATGSSKTISDVIGTVLKDNAGTWELLLNADIADVEGVVVGLTNDDGQEITLASGATSSQKYLIAVRGPMILNKDGINSKDVAGTTITMATLVTALAALNPPILVKDGPSKTEEMSV